MLRSDEFTDRTSVVAKNLPNPIGPPPLLYLKEERNFPYIKLKMAHIVQLTGTLVRFSIEGQGVDMACRKPQKLSRSQASTKAEL